MPAIRVTSLALLCAAALTVTAPAALAASVSSSDTPSGAAGRTISDSVAVPDDGVDETVTESGDVTSFGFTVTPEDIAPGGTVTLNATECQSPVVTASSGVFDEVTLSEGLPATAKVSEDAEPGAEYDVVFDCAGERGTATLTVGPATVRPSPGTDTGSHTGTGKHPDAGTHPPTLPSKPGSGVKAGAGGSLTGLSPTQIALGSLLVAGAVGGGVMLLRRPGDGV